MSNVQKVVTEYLTEFVTYGKPIGADESIVESGLVDSTTIFDMIEHLSETFNIEVDDDDIDPENFDTINLITAFVNSKLGG